MLCHVLVALAAVHRLGNRVLLPVMEKANKCMVSNDLYILRSRSHLMTIKKRDIVTVRMPKRS